MNLLCKKCGIQLTGNLEELQDWSLLNEVDGEDYIPNSFYCLSNGELYAASEGYIIVNLQDTMNMKNHSDPCRLNGCCGLDGLDGMNKVCGNGHEVATEKSDCWMPHAILFNPERVVIKLEHPTRPVMR